MADRIIWRVNRDQNGKTIMLAGDGWQRDAQWAIQDIQQSRHDYFVEGRFGTPRPVGVVNGPHGPYLRTFADSTDDNLSHSCRFSASWGRRSSINAWR